MVVDLGDYPIVDFFGPYGIKQLIIGRNPLASSALARIDPALLSKTDPGILIQPQTVRAAAW
jgi:hypothetical protein